MEENDIIYKMFEHTSSSKKSNKPTPILLMREFYKSYSRNAKPKSSSNLHYNIENKSKSSIRKFTTFLNCADNNSRVMTERASESTLKELTNKQKVAYFHSNTLKPVYKQDDKGECRKREYFKNSFTKFHPFFNAHPQIKKKYKTQDNNESKDDIRINKKQNKFSMSPNRTMTNLFRQMHQNKIQTLTHKQEKRNRFQQIRHDWLIDKLHKNFDDKEWFGKNKIRVAESFETTKQNIFPGTICRQ